MNKYTLFMPYLEVKGFKSNSGIVIDKLIYCFEAGKLCKWKEH